MRQRLLLILSIAAVLYGAPSPASADQQNSLGNPAATPSIGTTRTSFVLSVTYRGPHAPRAVTALVANRSLPMKLASGTQLDGAWTVTTTLPAGGWPVLFTAVASKGGNPRRAGPKLDVSALVATGSPLPSLESVVPPSPRLSSPSASAGGGSGSAGPSPQAPAAPAAATPTPSSAVVTAPAPTAGPVAMQPSPVSAAPADTGSGAAQAVATNAPALVASPATAGRSAAATAAPAPVETRAPRPDTDERAGATDIALVPLAAGLGALALSARLLLLAARRRGAGVASPASDDRSAALLRRRTERLGNMPIDEDPILASLGVPPRRERERKPDEQTLPRRGRPPR